MVWPPAGTCSTCTARMPAGVIITAAGPVALA